MKKLSKFIVFAPVCSMLLAPVAVAQSAATNTPTNAKVETKAKQLQALGTDPAVVSAVRTYNTSIPPAASAMTNERWKSLTQLDPAVRAYSKNALAVYLKSKMDPSVSEWFVSGAGGTKIAFQAKPSSWSHNGKEKHQVPMAGRVFIGPVEMDESSGQKQIQIGIPVLDAGRPIGSLVVGVSISKL